MNERTTSLEYLKTREQNLRDEFAKKLNELKTVEKFLQHTTERPRIDCFIYTFKNETTVHFTALDILDELSLDDIRFLIRKFPIGKNFEYKLDDGIVSVPYDVQVRYEHHTGKTNFVIQFCPKDFENTTFYIAFNANILPTDMLDFDKRSLSTSEYDNLEYKNMGHDKLKKVCVPFLTPKYFRNAYIVYQGGDARCNDSVTSQNIIDMILNN